MGRGCKLFMGACCAVLFALVLYVCLHGEAEMAKVKSYRAMENERPVGSTYSKVSPLQRSVILVLRLFGLTKHFENWFWSPTCARIIAYFYPLHAAQMKHAETYYSQQRDAVLQSAREFELHEYWGTGMTGAKADDSYTTLLHMRTVGMLANFLENGRDDFKIEKDKCDMMHFLHRNNLPMPPILGVYRDSPEQFLRAVYSADTISNVTEWPIFLKICHLTQGSEDSVRKLPDANWLAQNGADMRSFLSKRWVRRSNDVDRSFAYEANQLTDILHPGVLLQSGFAHDTELKVAVLWGRAYLGYVIGTEGIVLRDETYEQGGRTNFFGVSMPTPIVDHPELAWLAQEGHLAKVWDLAEKVAYLIGIDFIRVDIFVRKGVVSMPSVNEISLNSGQPCHMHSKFVSQLWAEPHVTGQHRHFQDTENKMIHLIDTEQDEYPNKRAMAKRWPRHTD